MLRIAAAKEQSMAPHERRCVEQAYCCVPDAWGTSWNAECWRTASRWCQKEAFGDAAGLAVDCLGLVSELLATYLAVPASVRSGRHVRPEALRRPAHSRVV